MNFSGPGHRRGKMTLTSSVLKFIHKCKAHRDRKTKLTDLDLAVLVSLLSAILNADEIGPDKKNAIVRKLAHEAWPCVSEIARDPHKIVGLYETVSKHALTQFDKATIVSVFETQRPKSHRAENRPEETVV